MSLIRYTSSLFLLAALSLTCARPEKAEEPKIFGNLYVRYLQDGGQIKAEASFFEGDSAHLAQPISIPGGVSFQGSGMESRNIQDKLIRYQYENRLDYPGKFAFQVQDEAGQSHRFAQEMPPVFDFLIPSSFSKKQGMDLELQPPPSSPEEELALLFSDTTGKASLIEIPAPISQKISLSHEQLSKLSPGPNQLYLVKKKRTISQEGPYRIHFDMEFYTTVKEALVLD